MATIQSLEAEILTNRTWINGVIANAKKVSELGDASLPISAGDLLPVSQSDILKKVTKADLTAGLGGFKAIDSFTATSLQTSFTVNAGSILDDGAWFVQVGTAFWNSTTGVTAFSGGAITINFATGEITFNIPLQTGTQVIIKHN